MITKRERNSIAAKMDMLNAVKSALIKNGFAKLGINTVAEEAKVDKSAIYRYYGSFEGLLSAYIEKQDYWLQSIQKYNNQEKITNELAKKIIREQYEALYDSLELQELIKWELADKTSISAPITVKREIYSQEILEQSRKILDNCGVNFNFILSVILGGIYYLVLHKEKGEFCKVDLTQKKQKDELIKTLEWLIDLLFSANETSRELDQVAMRAHKKGMGIEDIVEITGLSSRKVKELIEYN